MHLIEKSQGKTVILIGSPALLVDYGHKHGANAHQMNLLDLLLPPMLDLSHINACRTYKQPSKRACQLSKLMSYYLASIF